MKYHCERMKAKKMRRKHNFIGSIGIRYTNCEHVYDFQCLIQRQQVLHGWKFTLTKTGKCKWIAHRSYTNEGCYFCLACVRPRAICITLKSKAFTWYWHEKDNFYFKDAAKSVQNYFLQCEYLFILATRWIQVTLEFYAIWFKQIVAFLSTFFRKRIHIMPFDRFFCVTEPTTLPVLHKNSTKNSVKERSWERTNVTHRSSCRMVVFNSRPDNARFATRKQ